MTFDIDFIRRHYATFSQRVAEIRNRKGDALTLSEKILFAHLYTPTSSIDTTYGNFRPDRVAMQDATAQMALLQFMNANTSIFSTFSVIVIFVKLHKLVDKNLLANNDFRQRAF